MSSTSALRRVLERPAYLLAWLPVVTDWVDVGHLPEHPREFATEIVIGMLILWGVHGLYQRAERFRTLAETDALTGLGNRLKFRADVANAVSRARASRRTLALAFLDVDRLKLVNDTRGHEAGDTLLRDVGRTLERVVRRGVDGCYRLGGDEFAVLLSGGDRALALEVLERAFADLAPSLGDRFTCSVGVVTLADADSADALVQRADALMYAAKRGERPGHNAGGAFGTMRSGASLLPRGER